MTEMNLKIEQGNMRKLTNVYENFSSEIGYSFDELISDQRQAAIVRARGIFIIACLKYGFTYSSIAKFLNRDHTSVMHLANKYKNDAQIRHIVASKELKNLIPTLTETKKIQLRIPLTHSIYSEVYMRYQAKCAICGFDEITEVHHILPVKLGGTNDIENLVLLCPNHHGMADKGMLNVKDIPKLFELST